jgi:DNA-directed RNA polymerase subunit RPC12/RpoP
MKCPYCGATFDAAALEQYEQAQQAQPAGKEAPIQWEPYGATSGNGDWQPGEKEGMIVYTCSSCGGQIYGDVNTAATTCPYCGNHAIVSQQLEGAYRPDFIIPFKQDRAAAKTSLTGFYKGKFLLPRDFKDANHLEEVTGIYVPFWLFACDVAANIRYKATRVQVWSDRDNNYTKTDHYVLLRAGGVGFQGIPTDGSSKMEDALMDSIEPFDYTNTVAFNPAYLSGYYADKYDVSAEQCEPRATERVRNSTLELFQQTTSTFATAVPESTQINLTQDSVRYALLPVWMLNTKYKDKMYTFAMNGETGRFVGDLPCDYKRFWTLFAAITIVLAAVIFIVWWFL